MKSGYDCDGRVETAFDAREWWQEFSNTWSGDRRRMFLLNEEITKPLSVDAGVWPSIFETGDGDIISGVRTKTRPKGLALPEWTGPRHPLWTQLDELENHLSSVAERSLPTYRLLAMRRLGPETQFASGLTITLKFLGFDVADEWLVSGLTNCGYVENEKKPLADEFASGLNEWHLFSEPGLADEFRTRSDMRVPEHSPFFVYELWASDIRQAHG